MTETIYFVKGDKVVVDLSKLFQSGVLEEFTDIMNDSIKSMNINNTTEWWTLRTRLDRRMKVINISTLTSHECVSSPMT